MSLTAIKDLLASAVGLTMVSTAFAVMAALLFEAIVHSRSRVSRFPRIGMAPSGLFNLAKARADFLVNGKSLVEEGYRKYKNSIYVVQTVDMERLVLSNKYMDELRSRPTTELNSRDAQCDRHLAWWNTLDVTKHSSLHVDVSRVQLNQHINKVLDALRDEVNLAWSDELNQCHETPTVYHQFTTNTIAMNVISRVVNRILVGLPVCRNREWFNASFGFAVEAFAISGTLRPYSRLLRPFVYVLLGARRRLKHHIAIANKILNPIIKRRQAGVVSNMDMLQWMIDSAQGADKKAAELTHKTLFLCLASIVSSTMGVTHAIFDLCAHPEIIEPLRAEIMAVQAEEGGWTVKTIQRMDKLDSFLKESQRINHPGIFSFNRKVLKDISLSDGLLLPAGTFVSVPTYCLARDPDYYESPESFRPFRFLELRQKNPSEQNKYQFTSTGPTSMAFGYGLTACPGRFFAALEMKVALIHFLLNYDFRFPNGQTSRPDNIHVDERIWPSKIQQVEVRCRTADHDSLQ